MVSVRGGTNMLRLFSTICAVLTVLAGISISAQDNYFPATAFGDLKSSQEWIALYSKYLEAFDEPTLFDGSWSGLSQSYRFLWLRSFHNPVSVRLDVRGDGTGIVTIKVGEGPRASADKRRVQNTTLALTKREVDSFLDQIEAKGFWRLPPQEDPVSGPDGARWILEGRTGGQYHVVHRWTPKSGAVRMLCLYLAVDLGRMKLRDDEIY
jgi:hypothetical protein